MGNASKNFFALKGAPYMVYPYSHVKLFDNIKTLRYNSQKRCHATFRKLQPVYCVVANLPLFFYKVFLQTSDFKFMSFLACELQFPRKSQKNNLLLIYILFAVIAAAFSQKKGHENFGGKTTLKKPGFSFQLKSLAVNIEKKSVTFCLK